MTWSFNFFNINEDEIWEEFEIEYSRLIHFNIRKIFREYNFNYDKYDIEDCYSEIILKLYKQKKSILEKYNSNESKFSTYLTIICYNKIKDYMSSMKYKYNERSAEKLEIFNIQSDMKIDDILQVNEIFEKCLNEKEILIMKLFYYEELNSNEISEILGVSDSTIRVTKKKILEKIKRMYDV